MSADTSVKSLQGLFGCTVYSNVVIVKVCNKRIFNLQLYLLFPHKQGCLSTESRWGIALRIKYPINFCIICNYIRCFRSSEDASLQTTDGPLRYVFYRWIHALQFVMQTNRVTHQTADMMPRAPGPVPEFAR